MRRALLLVCPLLVAAGCQSIADYPLGGSHGGASASSPGTSNGTGYGVGSGDDDTTTPSEEAGSGTGPPTEDAGSANTQGDDGSVTDAGPSPSEGDEAGASQPPAPPTWTEVHDRYLGAGTIGNCPSCHVEMTSAPGAYAWLEQEKELDALDDPNASVLSWYGGGMPKHGPTSEPAAVSDIDAWAAAGRLDN